MMIGTTVVLNDQSFCISTLSRCIFDASRWPSERSCYFLEWQYSSNNIVSVQSHCRQYQGDCVPDFGLFEWWNLITVWLLCNTDTGRCSHQLEATSKLPFLASSQWIIRATPSLYQDWAITLQLVSRWSVISGQVPQRQQLEGLGRQKILTLITLVVMAWFWDAKMKPSVSLSLKIKATSIENWCHNLPLHLLETGHVKALISMIVNF